MRTRNRGQRPSIVSSLGLCPKNRKAKCLRKIVSQTKASVKTKRQILGSRMSRLANSIHEQSDLKTLPKNSSVRERMLSERTVHPGKANRSVSSKWKLAVDVSTRRSSTATLKSKATRQDHEAVELRDCSSGSGRGRKPQYAKVGRPRLSESIDPQSETKTSNRQSSSHPKANNSASRRFSAAEDISSKNTKHEPLDQEQLSSVVSASSDKSLPSCSQTQLETVVKRPRGRPRSSLVNKNNDTEKNAPPTQENLRNKLVVVAPDVHKPHNVSSCTPSISCTSIYSPKLIKKEDLYCASELRFGAADSVLQELLSEINTHGVVPKVSDRGKQTPVQGEETVSPDAVFKFDVPVVKNVFEELWKSSNTLLNLDTKDLFLALNGLLRPGVCELWRRRLEDQSKKLSRSHMGRLRPNPRPRRYSDMFVSGGEQSNGSRPSVSEVAVYTDKIRPGSRSVAVAAARLTAAKRLIRARSHHTRGPRVVTGNRCRISKKLQSIITGSELTSRTRRRSQKTATGAENSAPRTRRRPDVSHHIDWKFCYAHTEKQNPAVNQTTPKRRRKTEPSPDKYIRLHIPHQESDDFASTEGSPAVSNDMDTSPTGAHRDIPSVSTTLEPIPELPKSDPTSDDPGAYALEMKKSLARRLAMERSADGRRKRRHALTVQRKRPIERPVSNFVDSERPLWRGESAEKSDHMSDSSANSVSISSHDRPFRQSKWILPPTPKPKGNSDSTSENRPKSANQPVDVLRPRSITATAHARRSLRNSQLNSYMSHRGRISRRPDRMCRLTLLDRLLLGLNCSVSQNDEEIHVKRLHKDELSILTQRISKTGFSVQSLSVRRNTNNDAEYNIVLTFSPNADASMRRMRCSSLTTRNRLVGSGYSLDSDTRDSSLFSGGRSKCKTRDFVVHSPEARDPLRKSTLQNSVENSRRRLASSPSAIGECHSDTEMICKRAQYPKLRRSHSDSELVCPQRGSREPGLAGKWTTDSELCANIGGSYSVMSTETAADKHSPLPSTGALQYSKDWLRSTAFDRVTSTATERHYLPDTSVQKRGGVTHRTCSERPVFEGDAHSVSTLSVSHGITKRPMGHELHSSTNLAPFRRHSPRKVIRKVYTGSSTIPKILNRKRPTGSPSLNLTVPTCTAPPTPSLLSSLSHTVSVSGNTSSSVNSLPTSSMAPSVSSSSTPTIIFDEPTPTLPVCPPTSVAGFSFQYRRFPAPVVPVTVMPPSTKLMDSPVGTAAANPSSATFVGENRLPGMFRLRPVSGIPVGQNMSPLANKTSDRLIQNESTPISTSEAKQSNTASNSGAGENPTSNASGVDENVDSSNPQADIQTQKTLTISSGQLASDTCVAAKPLEGSTPAPVSAPTSHEVVPLVSPDGSTEMANCENEIPPDWDGSYTPATSMSASQLLKLKRLHDEAGRGVGAQGESRTSQSAVYPSLSNRVQSPQGLPLQGKQTQPIQSEATDPARSGKPSQFESSGCELTQQHKQLQQQQQPLSLHQSQRANLSSRQQFSSGICPASASGVGSEPVPSGTIEDADEFELKSLGLNDSEKAHHITHAALNQESAASRPPVIAGAHPDPMLRPPFTTSAPRLQKFSWPFNRPPGMTTSLASHSVLAPTTLPRVHPNISLNSEPGTVVSSVDDVSANPMAPRVVVQTSTSLCSPVVTPTTVASGESSIDHSRHFSHHPQYQQQHQQQQQQQQVTLSCNPLLLPPVGVGAYDNSPQTLSITGFGQANGVPLTGGPLKRTIVHKYHSFRKILPKSPEHLGTYVSTATLHSIPSLGSSSPGLTQIPVLGAAGGSAATTNPSGIRMYRNASFPQSNVLPCDSTGDTAYFVDIPTNLSDVSSATNRAMDRHQPHSHHYSVSLGFQSYAGATSTTNATTVTTSASPLGNNPASQLLKSLLENRDNKEASGAILTIPVQQNSASAAPKKTVPNLTNPTSSVTWNQPAHHSRGTWQLGKRVHNSSASSLSRTASDNPTSGHPRHGTDASDAVERPSLELASPVKLTPGSKSRLQQLQQHYQRRHSLQQVQSKNQSSEVASARASSQQSHSGEHGHK